MKKLLFLFAIAMTCIFANCPRKDGEVVTFEGQAVDLTGKALAKQKISLVSSDSFFLHNPVVMQQVETDTKGNALFSFIYETKKFFFVCGETTGVLQPLQLFVISDFRYKNKKEFFVMQFDSTTTIKIRMVSNKANMQRGDMYVLHTELPSEANKPIPVTSFPITTRTLDTTLNRTMFKNAAFRIFAQVTTQDTVIWRNQSIVRNGKRDTVFTINF